MNEFPIYELPQYIIQEYLGHIPQVPKRLFIRGIFPTDNHFIFLTIVGSRNHTQYGQEACEKLIKGLRGYPIVIVSGLAHGIDSIAHESALEAGLITIALPGSGLGEKSLYPRNSFRLAQKILQSSGALISELDENISGNSWTFPARNRLLAGISKATLIIEATNKSGSRLTARLATEYNRDVLSVPGPIYSDTSEGPNELIKLGATPITNSNDILEALGFHVTEQPMLDLFSQATPDEQKILKLLAHPKSRGDVIRELGLPITQTNSLISQMEMHGFVYESHGLLHRK